MNFSADFRVRLTLVSLLFVPTGSSGHISRACPTRCKLVVAVVAASLAVSIEVPGIGISELPGTRQSIYTGNLSAQDLGDRSTAAERFQYGHSKRIQ